MFKTEDEVRKEIESQVGGQVSNIEHNNMYVRCRDKDDYRKLFQLCFTEDGVALKELNPGVKMTYLSDIEHNVETLRFHDEKKNIKTLFVMPSGKWVSFPQEDGKKKAKVVALSNGAKGRKESGNVRRAERASVGR